MPLSPVRIDPGRMLRLAGLQRRYTFELMHEIPGQWQSFAPLIPKIPARAGVESYGVCFNMIRGANGFDYFTGVEISDVDQLPGDYKTLTVPAQPYAVFAHRDNVATIRRTIDAMWHEWLPTSGKAVPDPALFVEVYGPSYEPATGNGGFEIWLALKP